MRMPLTLESSIAEVLAHPVAGPLVMQALGGTASAGLLADPAVAMMMASAPIGRVSAFPGTGVEPEQLERLIAAANG